MMTGARARIANERGRSARARTAAISPAAQLAVALAALLATPRLSLALSATPDATFGTGGTSLLENGMAPRAVALQPDGNIVVLLQGASGAAVARYGPTGALDLGFGSGGMAQMDLSGLDSGPLIVEALTLQPDGKIIVVGSIGQRVLAVRLDTWGALDSAFGGGSGAVFTDITSTDVSSNSVFNGCRQPRANAVRVLPDGKLLLTGHTFPNCSSSVFDFLLRSLPSGDPDPTFGSSGISGTTPGVFLTGLGPLDLGWYLGTGTALSVEPDGHVLLSTAPRFMALSAVRLTANALLEAFLTAPLPGTFQYAQVDALLRQDDGRIIAAARGQAGPSPPPLPQGMGLAIARFQTSGALDTTFGQDGMILDASVAPTALMVAADGSIVAAGTGFLGAWDSSGHRATATCSGRLSTIEGTTGAVLQPDGKVVTASATASGGLRLTRFLSPIAASPPSCSCGDGIADDNEQCDDGNTVNDDACHNDCTRNPYALLYRAQVMLHSCDVDQAESSDDLWVSLRDGHRIWLNRPLKDLDRNVDRVYDVLLGDGGEEPLNHLLDIEYLEIGKTGDDGWCLDRVALQLDGVTMFSRSYEPGHWLDNGSGESNELRIPRSELTADSRWREQDLTSHVLNALVRLPEGGFRIDRAWLKSYLETLVGHAVQELVGDTVDWNDDGGSNGDAVELSRRADGQATTVDLDLEVEAPGHPPIDIAFDIAWSCWGGQLRGRIENADVGGLVEYQPLLDLIVDLVSGLLLDHLLAPLDPFRLRACGDIRVEPDGGILFLYDTDHDGLLDDWERHGVTYDPGDGSRFIDLPAMGADPSVPDIFVQLDWMDGTAADGTDCTHQRYSAATLQLVADAFARAPDGKIALHVDNGGFDPGASGSGHTDWNVNFPAALSRARAVPCQENLGTVEGWGSFDAIKNAVGGFRESGRELAFHYGIAAYSLTDAGGISREIPASDFVVAVGKTNTLAPTDQDTNKASAFMHELGHNLGLGHGGVHAGGDADHTQYKPNYLSIMNYLFAYGLIQGGSSWYLDYSRFDLPSLDEHSLDEGAGLGTTPEVAAASIFTTKHRCLNPAACSIGHDDALEQDAKVGKPIDLNCSGSIDSLPVSDSINRDDGCGHDTSLGVLESEPDWPHLQFAGGAIGGLGLSLPMHANSEWRPGDPPPRWPPTRPTVPLQGGHGLAVTKIKATKGIKLSRSRPTTAATVAVVIQNRGEYEETLADATMASKVIRLDVLRPNVSGCSAATSLASKNVLPASLPPGKRKAFFFTLAVDCSSAPAGSSVDETWRFVATVDQSEIDGAGDSLPLDNVCPRSPLGKLRPGARLFRDRGCGTKVRGVFQSVVETHVVLP